MRNALSHPTNGLLIAICCLKCSLPHLQDELLKYDRLDFMKLRGLEEVSSTPDIEFSDLAFLHMPH